jgi:hypothetical protein
MSTIGMRILFSKMQISESLQQSDVSPPAALDIGKKNADCTHGCVIPHEK